MNKSILIAGFLATFAIVSSAQTTPSALGAKLVAEHDAAYAKSHMSSTAKTHKAGMAMHTKHTVKKVATPVTPAIK